MKIRINISAMVITLLSCSIVTVALVGGNVDAATIETSPTISEPQLINPPPNGCAVKAGYPHLSTYWKKLGQYKVDTHALIDCTDPQQKIEVTATLQLAFRTPGGGGVDDDARVLPGRNLGETARIHAE